MFDRVHHVAYTVDDLDSYREFFGDVLEMEELDYRETGSGYNCAVYRVGETYIEVQEPAGSEGMQEWLDENGPGLNHVSFGVPDLDAAIEWLESKGIETEGDEPVEAPTFPGRYLIDMDEETSRGIYLQVTEEDKDEDPYA